MAAARSSARESGLVEAIGGFVVGLVLSSLTVTLAAAIAGYRLGSSRPVPVGVNIASEIGLWAGLVGGVVFYSRTRGSGHLGEDFGLAIRLPLDLLVGAAVGLATQLLLLPLLYLPFEQADPTFRHRLEAPAKADTSAAHGGWQIALLLIFFAIGAPIVEELFFRGLVLRSLGRWLGPVVGIAGSAVVFGLAHFELLQLPGLILFGVILGVLAWRTGRLGPGIVAHAAFNAVPVLTLTLH
ncbi:MAG TPA: CPBP family intramembrane glutamic endopeptidase [Acidimicrobiales bacterium]|nr:CPBP family intramembrane glutamic endopeptidase [Acidimicrobiales bacterium]